MSTEIWVATPLEGFLEVAYSPLVDTYPITRQQIAVPMPSGFDPKVPNHIPPPFPIVIPLLQGFDINYGTKAVPADHWLRQLNIDIDDDGWYDAQGDVNVEEPYVKILIGIRDDSPHSAHPDDPFVARIYFSVLVIYE